ncbi:hypothetical protein [Salinigranum sp. GCM10025319]|uniref:hypothetical protein n=1 Tax=Salinigranum sp. GCM10025319 TaxID=3252687 RepID=UPI00360D1C0E
MAPEPGIVDARRAGPPFAVGVLAVLGTLPVVTTLEPLVGVPRWLLVATLVGVGVGGVGLAAAVGSTLSRDVGLRALDADSLPGTGFGAYRLPVVAGVAVALATLSVHALAVALGVDPAPTDAWAGSDSPGVLAAVAGAVVTELLVRFGVMTFVVWLAWTYRPAIDRGVTRTGVWFGILSAALVGAVAAIPAAVVAGVDPAAVVVAAVVPFVGGVAFGLLYWRYDLVAAVVAHATASLLRAVVAAT